MGFFPENVREHYSKQGSGLSRYSSPYSHRRALEEIVEEFPPNLKQAMFAATRSGGIKAGTWDDCAFNRAGIQSAGVNIQSVSTAARVFGISTELVTRFITKWDSMGGIGDDRRTEILADALLSAGLTTPAWEPLNGPRSKRTILSGRVFKGSQTKFIEQLDKVNTLADLPGFSQMHEQAICDLIGTCN